MTSKFWTPSSYPNVKTERNQDYSAGLFEDEDGCHAKKKSFRDPISHRIIEKRRRDRMNNCLADLSRLIPSNYIKKGRGRIEKTEIIEMAIKHLKQLRTNAGQGSCESHEANKNIEQFKAGYRGCMDEVLNFLVKVEGHRVEDSICVRLINHLHREIDNILLANTCCKSPTSGETQSVSSSAGSGSTSGYAANGSSSSYSSDGNGSSGKAEHYRLPGASHCFVRMGSDTTSSNSDVGSCGKEEANAQDHRTSEDSVRFDMTSGYSTTSMPSLCEDQSYFPQYDRKESSEYNNQSKYSFDSGGEMNNPNQVFLTENMDCCEHHNNTGGYKFKTNMKKRFNASHFDGTNHNTDELLSEEGETKPCQEKECLYNEFLAHKRSLSPNYKLPFVPCHDDFKDKRSDHAFGGRKSASPMNSSVQISSIPQKSRTYTHEIPIFALHPKGAFYVPLIVDSALLMPKLSLVTESVPTLHPVTISVNFFGALRPYMIPLPIGEAQSFQSEPVLWSERVAHFISTQQSQPATTKPLTGHYLDAKTHEDDISNNTSLMNSFDCQDTTCLASRSDEMDSPYMTSGKSENERKTPESDKRKRRRLEIHSNGRSSTPHVDTDTFGDVT